MPHPRHAARPLNEDPPHRLRRRPEEVPAAVPLLGRGGIHVHQPQVRLVYQGRGLERLPRLLVGDALGGQLAKFLVHQGEEVAGGGRVAAADRGQDSRHLFHLGWAFARREVGESPPGV
jgi:hypothetical protein